MAISEELPEGGTAVLDGEAPGNLYVKLPRGRPGRSVPLALTIPDTLSPRPVRGLSVAWSREALAAFRKAREEALRHDPTFAKSLPYASLRGLVEVVVGGVLRIDADMGLDRWRLQYEGDPQPFLYLDRHDAAKTRTRLQPVLHQWVSEYFVHQYATPNCVPEQTSGRVFSLLESEALLAIQPFHSELPWPWSPETGTTRARAGDDYRALADAAARLLAGKELFQGLGPVRQIVKGRHSSSKAQLITEPVHLDERGEFSLLVHLEVVTLPSLHQPLLTVNVSKRRWLRRLKENTFDRNVIQGFTFSREHPSRAFTFSVAWRKEKDGSWQWAPDNAFDALRYHLHLPMEQMDGCRIARGDASTDDCRVLLAYRDAVSDGMHGVKAGVPEIDKLEAFEAIAGVLGELGLQPLTEYRRVRRTHALKDGHARTINAPTLLGAVLESMDGKGGTGFTPEYLASLDSDEIDRALREQFRRGLADFKHGERIVRFESGLGQPEADQTDVLETLIAANADGVRRLYPQDQPLLVVLYDPGLQADLRILQGVVRVLWGGAVEMMAQRLPAGVHGPREALPGKELRSQADRFGLRREAWRPLAEEIARQGRRVFCLVLAHEYYPPGEDGGAWKHDDKVNKPATRAALAAYAGASVQFLLPAAESKGGGLDLTNFLHRAQAALRDLISAHSGRVVGLRDAVSACFPESTAPRQVIGITVVRRNAGRWSGYARTFLPVALRLDVESGNCEIRCAYEGTAGLVITPWQSFGDGLATVSRISPVRLAEARPEARTRFMRFCEEVITDAVEARAQPLVVIDSSNCAGLWGWLTDRELRTTRIEVGSRQWMEQEWNGARVVRVRQDLAPGVVEDKSEGYAESAAGDARPVDSLEADVTLRRPTSVSALYRLESPAPTGCAAYLSVGNKTLHKNARGLSCYRTTRIAAKPSARVDGRWRTLEQGNAAGRGLLRMGVRQPHVDQWPTPNPLEIVVALRQDGDDPDRIAELVERLRYGFGHYAEWTTLPAPLFFERVIREYISGFALTDLEGPEDEPTSEETP